MDGYRLFQKGRAKLEESCSLSRGSSDAQKSTTGTVEALQNALKIREVIFKGNVSVDHFYWTKTIRQTKPYLGHLSKLWKVHRTCFMWVTSAVQIFVGGTVQQLMLSVKFQDCLGGLLPHTNIRDVPSRNEALLDSQTEETCFEIPWSVIALAVVITVLWSLGFGWAY